MRRLSLLLTVTFSLSLLQAFGATTIKPGASCTKVNQVQIVKSVKYTCMKNGKKLTWVASDSITKVAPSLIPITTPVITPTPLPLPKSDSMQTPATNQSATPTIKSPTDLENTFFGKLLKNGILEIHLIPENQFTQSIRLFVDPAASKNTSINAQAAAEIVFKKFGYLINPSFRTEIILSESSEYENNAFKSSILLSTWPDLNSSNYLLTQESDYKKSFPGTHFAFPLDRTGFQVNAMGQFWRLPKYEMSTFDIYFGGISETFHAIQWGLVGSESGGVWPTWFYEGEMVAMGRILASGKDISIEEYFKNFKYGIPYQKGPTDLSKMEDHDFSPIVYQRGEDATYYLLGKYGWQKLLKFMSDKDSVINWKRSFENTFGISVDDFYREVIPFFNWMDEMRALYNV